MKTYPFSVPQALSCPTLHLSTAPAAALPIIDSLFPAKVLVLLFCLAALAFYRIDPVSADEVVFTLPHCTGYDYPVELSTRDGKFLKGPAGGLYCDASKIDVSDGYALTQTIDQTLGARIVRSIDLTAYYFRDKRFAEWICSLSSTDDAPINIFHQRWITGVSHVSDEFHDGLQECSARVRFHPIGCDIFDDAAPSTPDESTSSEHCKLGFVSILHAKIGRFVTTSGETIIFAGSGNINKSLYANVDDWLVFDRDQSDPLAKQFRCMFSTLHEFSGKMNVRVKEFRLEHASCLDGAKETSVSTEPQIILTPYGGTQYFSNVVSAIGEAEIVWIASQFLDDNRIIRALSQRSKGELKILLDDDNYWSMEKRRNVGYAEWDRVKRLWVLKGRPDTQIRYLQTNHHSSGKNMNMLHARIIITSTGGHWRVYSGSAYWRQNSFVFNIEQQVIIEKPELVSRYKTFFERLWKDGLSATQMPFVDVPANSNALQ